MCCKRGKSRMTSLELNTRRLKRRDPVHEGSAHPQQRHTATPVSVTSCCTFWAPGSRAFLLPGLRRRLLDQGRSVSDPQFYVATYPPKRNLTLLILSALFRSTNHSYSTRNVAGLPRCQTPDSDRRTATGTGECGHGCCTFLFCGHSRTLGLAGSRGG